MVENKEYPVLISLHLWVFKQQETRQKDKPFGKDFKF